MFETIPFSGGNSERHGLERDDAAWVAARLADPASRFLPMHDLKALAGTGDTPALAWLPRTALPEADDLPSVLLGELAGACRFAVDVTACGDADDPAWQARGRFLGARTLAATLPAAESALLAQARSLIDWHARHRFCAVCGALTTPAPAGHLRRCEACGARHFPRVDPVVIMLVTDGDRCLLGRQPHFAPGMHSCLAGFVEPGETLEAAVRREILEEAGIRIGTVRYLGSQPWPFPSALMLGCHAEALDTELVIDPRELESADWYHRDEVSRMLAASDSGRSPRAPSTIAIAYYLMRHWVGG